MPGASSSDALINAQTTLGQFLKTPWNKNFLPTTAAVAGEAHMLARGAGAPTADAIFNAGTNLTWQSVTDQTASAGSILHGGNVTPTYKFLTSAEVFSSAVTTAPYTLMLVDLVGFVRVTTTTLTTAQAITSTLSAFGTFTADTSTDLLTGAWINLFAYTRVQVSTTTTLPAPLAAATDYYVIRVSDTTIKLATSYANAVAGTAIDITTTGTGTHTINTLLPRYTSGAGLQSVIWNTNATPMGAATPTLQLGYTNAVQSTGRLTPATATLPTGKTAAPNGLILYSGTGAGKYNPYMPLQSGDTGYAKLDTIQQSVSYVSGEYSIGLVKHLASFNCSLQGGSRVSDFVNQTPAGVRIYDGAALYWILQSGAATPVNSAFQGDLDFTWV